MTHTIPINANQRGMVAKMVLDILRSYCGAYLHTYEIGTHSVDVLIGISIFIGQSEGRLMSASDIAAHVGIPRSTVVRRLNSFRDSGLVKFHSGNSRRVVWIGHVNDQSVLETARKVVANMQKVLTDISKMDTDAMDQSVPRK